MATWPDTLPRPLADAYGIQPVDPVIRTDMDVGAPRVRRRSRARNDRLQVVWQFTPAQAATFRAWYDDDTGAAGGAAWFDVQLDIAEGGLQSVEARFAEMWRGELQGKNQWRISATLEVR
jgi:hypothetical protein